MKNIRIPALLCLLAGLFVSCRLVERNPEDDKPVDVLFKMEWTALGISPSGCTIILYPEDGGNCIKYRTNSVERFCGSVPPGLYSVVVFSNSESEYATMSFIDAEDAVRSRVILESVNRGWIPKTLGRVVCEPEKFAVARCENFRVRSSVERGGSSDSLVMVPELGYELLGIEIPVKGINNLASVRAYVSGMYGGRYLCRDMAVDTSATFALGNWTLSHNEGDYTCGVIATNLRCFSFPQCDAENASRCTLHLETMLVDGETVIKRDFSLNELDGEDDLTLPDVKPQGSSDGGLDVNFIDWGEENIFVIPI